MRACIANEKCLHPGVYDEFSAGFRVQDLRDSRANKGIARAVRAHRSWDSKDRWQKIEDSWSTR